MFLTVFCFIVGIILGFGSIAIIASSKQRELWDAIQLAAYKEDISLCRQIVEQSHV